MFPQMRAKYFLSGPALFVAVAFLYNAVVGVFGMNGLTGTLRLVLCGIGLCLALVAAWQTASQKKEIEEERDRVDGFLRGGNSFCFLSIPYAVLVPNQPARSYVLRLGEFPLFDLRMRVTDIKDVMHPMAVVHIGDFGSSIADIGAPTIEGPVLRAIRDDEHLKVFFNARNGAWVQDLILKKSRKLPGWLSATRVTRGLTIDSPVVYEEIAQGFEEEFGEPNWRELPPSG